MPNARGKAVFDLISQLILFPEIIALVAPRTDTLLVRRVLEAHIKPLFARNPHPYVDTTTGRKLARAAGGPHAAHDHFEDQAWKSKNARGAIGALYWCVQNTSVSAMS